MSGIRARLDGCVHGLRVGMDCEKRCAQARDALYALRHGVANVVQLEIEKDPLAGLHERFSKRQATRECQLIADLVEGDRIAKPIDHGLGVGRRGHIEREDQAIARMLHPAPPATRKILTAKFIPTGRKPTTRDVQRW
jgi:hypothetical protein